jgi:hypothetical protein
VEIGRDIVELLALELAEVPREDSFRLCTSTSYLEPRGMLRSTGSGGSGSHSGLEDEVVPCFGVRWKEYVRLLGPTRGSECAGRGTHGIL